MGKSKSKSSKTDRKRKSGCNLKYIGEQKHDKSHVRRITKHLTRFLNDAKAQASLAYYKARLGVRSR